MRLAVVTAAYPTAAEPYRGAPIWATLRPLARLAEVRVFCTYPRYPVPSGVHRDFIHARPSAGAFAEFAGETVPFAAVPLLSRGVNGHLVTRALAGPIARHRPEVVLTYWLYPEGFASTRVAARLGVPSVLVSLGSDLKRLPPRGLVRRWTQVALRRADAVVGVSRDLTQVAQGLGAPAERTHVLFNGVDTAVFRVVPQALARQAVGIAADAKLALYVGRLVPLKRVGALVDALEHAPGFELAVIGNGSQEAALREQVRARGLTGRVRFLGAQPPAAIAGWMNAADALCLVSESEGQPNVVVEALHCGRPVLATAVGGIPEVVGPGDGVLLPDAEPARIGAALVAMRQRAWDREAIARRHLRSWDEVAKETLALCDQVRRARSAAP